jgi:hypothetical protein
MISRVREGFEAVFFETTREGVEKLGREGSGFETRDWEGAGVARVCFVSVTDGSSFAVVWDGAACSSVTEGMPISEGSEESGSEPMPGFNGARNGDLNGLCSVFAASFSRRRLACGVDISDCTSALI